MFALSSSLCFLIPHTEWEGIIVLHLSVRLSVIFRVQTITYLCIDWLPYYLVQMLSSLRRFAVTLTQVHTSRVKVTQDIWRSEYTCLCSRYNLLMHWRLGGDMAVLWMPCKLTWKRNATNIFPQHFVSRANINAIFIYMNATLYTLYAPSFSLHSIHHFGSSKQRCTKCSCYLFTWRINTKHTVYTLPHLFTVQKVYSTRI